MPVTIPPNASQKILTLPEIGGLTRTYFLDLSLVNGRGEAASRNFYCLSTKPDVLDEAKTTWFVTPMKGYADLTRLDELPPVKLNVKPNFGGESGSKVITVELENPGSHLALFVELRLVREKSGESVRPIFWEDNYFSLLPGEKRTIRGRFSEQDLEGEQPILKVGGWNIK